MQAVFLFVLLCVWFSSTFDIRRHLHTKSPYLNEFGDKKVIDPSDDSSQWPKTCTPEPVNVQHVGRHGGRYPTAGSVDEFFQLEVAIQANKAHITQNATKWLVEWRVPYSVTDSGDLLLSGKYEQAGIGTRLMERFPALAEPYAPKKYIIQTTEIPRCGESANIFANALFSRPNYSFGSNPYWWTYSHRETDDETLRFFDSCPRYIQDVKLPRVSEQKKKFEVAHMPAIIQKLQQKIDPSNTWVITEALVELFFDGCAFDVAIFNCTNHFCALFDEEDIERLDYLEDLGQYYKKSNPFEVNYQMTCRLITELIDNMQGRIDGKEKMYKYQSAKFRFAHAETVIPLVAALGLYPTPPSSMMWDATIEQIRQRTWRTSTLSCFSANLLFVLYNCTGIYYVKVLHNEKAVTLPGCDNQLYCPLEQFKLLLKPYYGCNFTAVCALETSAPTGVPTSLPPTSPTCSADALMTSAQFFNCLQIPIIFFVVTCVFGCTALGFLFAYLLFKFQLVKFAQSNGPAYSKLTINNQDEPDFTTDDQ